MPENGKNGRDNNDDAYRRNGGGGSGAAAVVDHQSRAVDNRDDFREERNRLATSAGAVHARLWEGSKEQDRRRAADARRREEARRATASGGHVNDRFLPGRSRGGCSYVRFFCAVLILQTKNMTKYLEE